MMSGPHPQSHGIHRPRGHMTNQRRYISYFTRPRDPKLSRVVTQDEETPPTKSRDTSIKGSRTKSKIFYLRFHKAQSLQTQQVGNQNGQTPPNISFNASITLSRDNYPVGSAHLFHFLLKFSPKNRQISNDHDNTENVQLA